MNSFGKFFILITIVAVANASTRFNNNIWGYKYKSEIRPYEWHTFQPKCLGSHQSPININFDETLFDKKLAPIQIVKRTNFTNKSEIWHMTNNGHSGETSYFFNPFTTLAS